VSQAVRAAEVWNPATGLWRTLARNAVRRGYHSSTLLLPDGRILHTGSGDGSNMPDERNAELFTPPYLLRGPRPVFADAPALVGYGSSFRLATDQAADIAKVSLVRLGSVTHAFDMNQRFQRLSFSREVGALTVVAPSSSNRAPPGHYLLFILDYDDVPSAAKIVKLGHGSEPTPPPNASPEAGFVVGCSGFTCTFADRSNDSDGDLSVWSWDFGDGSGSQVRDPSHVYGSEGRYTVTLAAVDDDGAQSVAPREVTVSGPEFPIALQAAGRATATKQFMDLVWSDCSNEATLVFE